MIRNKLVLLVTVFLLLSSQVMAQQQKTDYFNPRLAVGPFTQFGTVPDTVASGQGQVVDVSRTGALNHQVVWTSSGASTAGVTVVVATSTGTTFTTANSSTALSGSYTFTGAYRYIRVTITATDVSVDSAYSGAATTAAKASGSGASTYVAYWTTAFNVTGDSSFTYGSGAATLGTSLTVPTIIGGTAVAQASTFKTTTGIGVGDSYAFTGGNNGATTFGTLTATGLVMGGTTLSTSGETIIAGQISGQGSIQAGAGSKFMWNGRSQITSPSDGVISIGLNTASDNTASLNALTNRIANAYVVGLHSGASAMTLATSSGDVTALTLATNQAATFGATVSVTTLTGATATHVCYDAGSTNMLATCTSLREFKDQIEPLGSVRDLAMRFIPSSFIIKNTGRSDVGLIAEDVEAVDSRFSTYYQGKLNGVNYDAIGVLALKVFQELNPEVRALKARVTALEAARQ